MADRGHNARTGQGASLHSFNTLQILYFPLQCIALRLVTLQKTSLSSQESQIHRSPWKWLQNTKEEKYLVGCGGASTPVAQGQVVKMWGLIPH